MIRKLSLLVVLVTAPFIMTGCLSNKSQGSSGSSGYSSSKSYAFPSSRPATGKKVFIFSPRHTAWALYDANGNLVKTGRASGGSNYCPDLGRSCRTPSGRYTVYHKRGADCTSSKYPLGEGGAKMPHCMFFNGGYAVHGSYHVPNYNASHGCIRVTPGAAAWLNNHLSYGSTVIVKPY